MGHGGGERLHRRHRAEGLVLLCGVRCTLGLTSVKWIDAEMLRR